MIVEVEILPKKALLLQSLLLGEDGLGTIRCFDPERKKQQIWTVHSQLEEVYGWLESLPTSLQLRVTGEWRYDGQTT
ncbi:MAG: DUF4911 domain-containing protein [Mariprofundaceae bacterium]